MPKNQTNGNEVAVETYLKGLELGLDAQEKAEEMWEKGLEETFEAAAASFRQVRQYADSMRAAAPWAATMKPAADLAVNLQEKSLEAARTSAKVAFENYRKTVSHPMRKIARDAAVKLAKKVN